MRNSTILILLMLFQISFLKAGVYVNPDNSDWITIDSVGVAMSDGTNATAMYYNLDCADSLNCIGHYGNIGIPDKFSILRKTTDGGNTWFDIRTDIKEEGKHYPRKRFLFYPNKDLVLIGCDSGYVLRSTNGGIDWDLSKKTSNIEVANSILYDMDLKDSVVCLHHPGDNKYISTDAGESFTKMQFNTDPQLTTVYRIRIADSNTLYISGVIEEPSDGFIYFFKSDDLGKSWSLINKVKNIYSFIENFYFLNDNLGYSISNTVIGKRDYDIKGSMDTTSTVYQKTTDGGVSWQYLYEHIDIHGRFNFIQNSIGDSLNIYSPRQLYRALRTKDGGENWEFLPDITYNGDLYSSRTHTWCFLTPNTLLIGHGPRILKNIGNNTSALDILPQDHDGLVYPNPTDAYLYIDKYAGSPMDYEIFDYAGKKVLTGTLNGYKIDVSALPAAAYIIVLDDGADKRTMKFIKK